MPWLQRRDCAPPWTRLLYLIYLGFLFFQPAISHAGWKTWCAAFATAAIFVALYLIYLLWPTPIAFWCVIGMAALGFAYWPFNSGASSFFIYAAVLFGYLFQPKLAFACMGALLTGMAIESWVLHLIVWYWAPSMIMTVAIGAMNIHAASEKRSNTKLRLAQEEIEHLAKVAERERIARDMHDVLGHTLSVVILKSELASRLLNQDPARAHTEISEVEQIARDALAEVRKAIGGYRTGSLAEEFARARSTLETAGMHVDIQATEPRSRRHKLSPAQETVLALVVREAVTNVVRHSAAANCRIHFEQGDDRYKLEIQDDGRGSSDYEGNGLRGMRERIEALEGTMTRDGSHGTRLTITIPIGRHREAIA